MNTSFFMAALKKKGMDLIWAANSLHSVFILKFIYL